MKVPSFRRNDGFGLSSPAQRVTSHTHELAIFLHPVRYRDKIKSGAVAATLEPSLPGMFSSMHHVVFQKSRRLKMRMKTKAMI